MDSNAPSFPGHATRNVVVITALPLEYAAVREHIHDLREVVHPRGTIYEVGRFRCSDGTTWTVGVVEVGAGSNAAAMEAERAIAYLNPTIVLFVGVAGGLKDVKLHDVVVATRVYGYESGKAAAEFLPRPDVGESSYTLIQRSRAEARKSNWKARVAADQARDASVFVAPIAAGEKVVASTKSHVSEFIRAAYGDALAVEMEGRGFLLAAHGNQSVSALVVRGVSDLIDGKSSADARGSQVTAARNASAFAFEVIDRLDAGSRLDRIGEYTVCIVGTIRDIDRHRAEAIVAQLRNISNDASITLKKIMTGSVILVLSGSLAGFEVLRDLGEAGELSKMLGVQVFAVRWSADFGGEPDWGWIITVLQKAAAGSRAAMNALFESIYPFILDAAKHLSRSQGTWADAESIALESAMALFQMIEKNPERFAGQMDTDANAAARFRQLLTGITKRQALDLLNRERRERRVPLADEHLGPEDAMNSPLASIERLDEAERLLRSVQNLSERERAVVTMRYFQDRSWDDIAKVLDASPSSVRELTRRAVLGIARAFKPSEKAD